MKNYLAPFNPGIIGLTGTEEQLKQAASAYKSLIPAAAPEQAHEEHAHGEHDQHGAGANYMVNHSGFIY